LAQVCSGVHGDGSVVVAVPVVRVVEMPTNEIVDVIAVGNLLVTAIGAVNVRGFVSAAGVLGSAISGVGRADFENVLVDVVTVRVMQMRVVQVVEMIAMLDRRVPASGAVLVRVVCMNGVL
jgi:hypothetical protein